MKRFSLFLAFFAFAFQGMAQTCTPVDCSANLPAYGGICDTLLAVGTVNVPYSDSESFVLTDNCFDAGLIDPNQAGIAVKISTIDNFTFTGQPAGTMGVPNQPSYSAPAGSYVVGCAALTGTPTEAGVFEVSINFLADVVSYPFGGGSCSALAIPVNDQAAGYAIGVEIKPDASFSGLAMGYCQSDADVTMTVTGTTGGTFSGTGVSGNVFSPATAGVGTHAVTYTVTAQQGAAVAPSTNSMTIMVTVGSSVDYYVDSDNDGYGDMNGTPTAACGGAPAGTVANNLDCNDGNNMINPGMSEVCDGVDNNCSGTADDGLTFVTYYADTDNDGYGDANGATETTCDGAPTGFVNNAQDCNDNNNMINPGMSEVCDGVDNNCSGTADDGLTFVTYYIDTDNDGFGDANGATETTCDGAPAGYVDNAQDCDDTSNQIYPGNTEVCDGLDNDCAGGVDDGLTFVTYYKDADNDGYGDPNGTTMTTCDGVPADYSADNTDCDDTNPNAYPGATEVPDNGVDEDCDGGDLVDVEDITSVFGLKAFPNPASTSLFVVGELNKEAVVEIFDIRGQKLRSVTTTTINPSLELDVTQLAAGLYILKITDNDWNVGTMKFSVAH